MSRRSSVEEAVAMMEAQNSAYQLLAELPKEDAAVTSVKVAYFLAQLWEIEAEAMIRRGDERLAFQLGRKESCWLDSAVKACSQHTSWRHCSTEYVQASFAKLSPDAAAWEAYRVARCFYRGENFQ